MKTSVEIIRNRKKKKAFEVSLSLPGCCSRPKRLVACL